MGAVTIAQVLQHAEKLEETLADFYRKLSCETTREDVRLLADYMSRHRIRLSDALSKIPQERVHRVCSTALPYEPVEADLRPFERPDLPPDATTAEVIDLAVQFDECLIGLYRQMAQQPVCQEAKGLFLSLVRTEERDETALKKIKAMHYF